VTTRESPGWLTAGDEDVVLEVVVVPRASRARVMGLEEGRLKIHLVECVDGSTANRALVTFLAGSIGVDRVQIEVVAGGSNLRKTVRVSKVSRNQVLLPLTPHVSG